MRPDQNGGAISIAIWGTPQIMNLSVASTNLQLVAGNFYRLWSSVNSFFLMGPDNTTTATTNSHPLQAGLDVLVYTSYINTWIAGIVSSGTGVLYVSQIDPRSS